MLNRLISLFAGKQHNPAAVALYRCIVEQARQPDFYTHHGVPDSLDGRFDMIVLHIALVLLNKPAKHVGEMITGGDRDEAA